MHVCFSRGAIDAGTESVSHKPRSSLGEAVDFFQNGRYRRFEQTNEGSLLGIEISTSFPAKRDRRRQASAGIGDEETRSRILQRSERPLTWRDFCPFANRLRVALCRNGQKRPKLRTGPHATTKGGTNLDVHALGRFRVPSRPTANEWSVWASQEDEAEGLL